jgi:hypothetical protein
LLLYASAQVQEIALDYTECAAKSPEIEANSTKGEALMDNDRVDASFRQAMVTKPTWGHYNEEYKWPSGKQGRRDICVLTFTPPGDIKAPVLLYYRLTNFYQNHRRYVKSFDTNQLKGEAVSKEDIHSGECAPLSNAAKPDDRPYYPCGLIANSMFNDTYEYLQVLSRQGGSNDDNKIDTYGFKNKGIIWSTEGDLYGPTKYQPKDVKPPPFWAERYPEDGYDSLNQSQLPQLHEDEAFQVWMRTAGLPTFSKLALRNDQDKLNGTTSYRLKIADRETPIAY